MTVDNFLYSLSPLAENTTSRLIKKTSYTVLVLSRGVRGVTLFPTACEGSSSFIVALQSYAITRRGQDEQHGDIGATAAAQSVSLPNHFILTAMERSAADY